MKNGRKKGNDFENYVCRALTRWSGFVAARGIVMPADWRDWPVDHLPFRRRSTNVQPISGFWSPGGDVLCREGVQFPYAVECKAYGADCELDGLFSAQQWPVWEWWQQAESQAMAVGLYPLLVFKRNNRPVYVLLQESECHHLSPQPGESPLLLLRSAGRDPLVLTTLENLINTVPWARVAARYRTLPAPPSRARRAPRTK